jgi:hypothetical protein
LPQRGFPLGQPGRDPVQLGLAPIELGCALPEPPLDGVAKLMGALLTLLELGNRLGQAGRAFLELAFAFGDQLVDRLLLPMSVAASRHG